jgi:hypothetical protein
VVLLSLINLVTMMAVPDEFKGEFYFFAKVQTN